MIIYTKYNQNRKEEFQLITTIEKVENNLFSSKTTQNSLAEFFLMSFFNKYEYLKSNNFSFDPVEPIKINKDKIRFKYEEGKTLDSVLFEQYQKSDEEKFIEILKNYVDLLLKNKINKTFLAKSFVDIFGDTEIKVQDCLNVGCLDLNFDNIILGDSSNKISLIDYEWTFYFPIPYKYIFFRAITTFYFNHIAHGSNREFISLKEVYDIFKISEKEKKSFIFYEYNFQKYVNNDFFISLEDFQKGYFLIEENHETKDFVSNQDKDVAILNKEKEISLKEEEIKIKDENIQQKEQKIKQLNQEIQQKYQDVQERDNQINMLLNSTSWKITAPIRFIKDNFFKILKIIKKAFFILKKEGLIILVSKIIIYLKKKINNKIKSEKYNTDHIDGLNIKKIKKIEFSEEKNPDISIVIPVFNKWKYTYNCIESLKENIKNISFEVIVVDDGSNDETKLMINNIKNIIYVKNEKNLGFVGSCNAGAKKAKGQYVVFLNNDTYIKKNWLNALWNTFQNNKNIGLVGSKLIYPDGKLQEAGGIVWKNKNAWNYGRMQNPNSFEFNYLKDVDYCSGASIMIPKDIFEKLDGFDTIFSPGFFEDTDIAFRVRQLGLRTVYQPKSELFHFEGVSAGTDLGSGMKKYQEINKDKFFKRWHDVLEKENFNDMVDGPFLARDKSKDKKVVLFMDNNVPTFDKDAGSFIAFQYLKILNDLNYKVIFWSHNLEKIEPYTDILQQMGIEVSYGEANFNKFIRENGKFIDFAFISRPHVASTYIDIVKRNSNAKILYIAHDLHFLREMRGEEINKCKDTEKQSDEIKKIEESVMRKADISLFFSDREVEIVKKEFPYVSATIIPWIQEIENEVPSSFDDRKGLMFIGGYNHQPNVDAVKWFHDEIFPKILEKIPDIKAIFYGSNPPEEIVDLNADNFKIAGFIKEDDVKNIFNSARIFIAPLRFGAGFKGKIAKAMSNGIPVVTTDIGAEGIGLVDAKNAFVVNVNAEEYTNKVIELYSDKVIWTKFSNSSIDHVKENFSIKNAENKIIEILKII